MSLTLSSYTQAISPLVQTYIFASGGVPPYTYSVAPNGIGGSINPSSGLYTAPAVYGIDTIQVMDSDTTPVVANLKMTVTDSLRLVCDILKKELSLADDRVYLWDQKLMKPTDGGLFIAVSILSAKPFGNTKSYDGSGSGLDAIQSVNMKATISIDIISRSIEAVDRKEEVIMALNSPYSESQQEINSFHIGRISSNFVNLSEGDGAAIPYRFNISTNIQYFKTKIKSIDYYDQFQKVQVTTND